MTMHLRTSHAQVDGIVLHHGLVDGRVSTFDLLLEFIPPLMEPLDELDEVGGHFDTELQLTLLRHHQRLKDVSNSKKSILKLLQKIEKDIMIINKNLT